MVKKYSRMKHAYLKYVVAFNTSERDGGDEGLYKPPFFEELHDLERNGVRLNLPAAM